MCNGAAISRTTYVALFSAVGTIYGAGDGNTTFALPNLIDKFIEGSATAGTEKSAGLPNITGDLKYQLSNNGTQYVSSGTGAFSATGSWGCYPTANDGGTATRASNASFDASRSSSIYGNSATVQPPALTMKPFIYTGKTALYKWLRTA